MRGRRSCRQSKRGSEAVFVFFCVATQVIEGYAADVVAVQEVRTVGVEGSPGWRCQATELAQLLPAYTFVRDTAMEFEVRTPHANVGRTTLTSGMQGVA